MKLKVLGCSGGIGSNSHTTALLLDDDILIDAGSGVGTLALGDLLKIDHVFVTHSHLDHIAFIPFLVDTAGSLRDRPLIVHALPETLECLQKHIFNWHIWPDFSCIPDAVHPYMRYEPLAVGETVVLDSRRITPLPACHAVPATGFQLDSGRASLVFTGDTTASEALWEALNRITSLRYLIIESAFSDAQRDIAGRAGHFHPALLADELNKLQQDAEIYITHLRQNEADITMREILARVSRFDLRRLASNQLFEF
ncbi:3',5'-cyclic-nucleotide phosphodiesterase [Nitrosomonas sp.]|uniref:3',5'-cyclic-nucleotide phosphodiesterase n=1 Tax=Nitrosomonas sp. TaxID=42353 RepID=UPI0025F64A10|nr:3',5'-cyclic-nucleotide phosphodiesterase [Nitrosomonas sp.]MCC6916307.1 3',5'-cyclic-nucleotide phosphodiesterase [Nitrosomonas sp.]